MVSLVSRIGCRAVIHVRPDLFGTWCDGCGVHRVVVGKRVSTRLGRLATGVGCIVLLVVGLRILVSHRGQIAVVVAIRRKVNVGSPIARHRAQPGSAHVVYFGAADLRQVSRKWLSVEVARAFLRNRPLSS